MTKRKSSIRKMRGLPTTREFYHLLSDLSSVLNRLDKLGEKIARAESGENALYEFNKRRGDEE